MKKIFIILFSLCSLLNAQSIQFGEVKGLFLSAGVGARIPASTFADKNNPGGGFDFAISYSDNLLIPFFLNASVGYTHFPGSQDFYALSDHSSFSSNVILGTFGARYYISPIMDDMVLVMPVVDVSLLYAHFNDLHQFKTGSGKSDFNENYSKFGFQAGAGVSMFMFDLMAYYNYLPGHSFFSVDIRARIPIFATM
jgi:hypothetical protein